MKPYNDSHFQRLMSKKTVQRKVVLRSAQTCCEFVPAWASSKIPADQVLVCLKLDCGHIAGPYLVRNGDTHRLMTSDTVACLACQELMNKLDREVPE